jgi:Holliday junction DNA helicase RuvA
MYAYIRGKVVSKGLDNLVIDNHGIGYRLQAASLMLGRFGAIGEETTAYTHLYVREDTFALYGFPTPEDVNLFELLLTVSGIGPKVASSVVASVSPGQFALAVITGDTKTLTQVRGIGKKGAERMILELKDKLKGADWGGDSAAIGGMTGVGAAALADAGQGVPGEAISALMVLGYTSQEASKAVSAVAKPDLPVEELIRLALRQLAR